MSIKHITLSKDLSLTSPGFAVLGITSDGSPLILDKSVVKTDSKMSHGQRLLTIETEIERLILEYKPVHIVREKGFSRFPAVTQTLSKVVGISDLISYEKTGLDVYEIAATSVKKLVTGSGKASKEDVAEAVFKRLQITNTDDFYVTRRNGRVDLIDDLTDACAVGLAYYYDKGLIK